MSDSPRPPLQNPPENEDISLKYDEISLKYEEMSLKYEELKLELLEFPLFFRKITFFPSDLA